MKYFDKVTIKSVTSHYKSIRLPLRRYGTLQTGQLESDFMDFTIQELQTNRTTTQVSVLPIQFLKRITWSGNCSVRRGLLAEYMIAVE